jgi:hypothetical protein
VGAALLVCANANCCRIASCAVSSPATNPVFVTVCLRGLAMRSHTVRRKFATHGGLAVVVALAARASNASNVACGSDVVTDDSVEVSGVGRDAAVRGSDGIVDFTSGTETKQSRQYFSFSRLRDV